jgi:hypothetical protein
MRQRSDDSLAFEEYWRSLRTNSLVPSRYDFYSAKAARFLPDTVLMEAPADGGQSLRIVVAGERFQDAFAHKLAGTDHLDALPAQYHAGAIASARLIAERPCGLWQAMPLYFPKSGHGGLMEVTAFPLAVRDGRVSFIALHVSPIDELLEVPAGFSSRVGIDTSVEYRFIDIGAGEPTWPPEGH